ncbi:MAG: hypothetical protein LBC20_15005, partial [Planctomycetaceae bacterium]|nr:hypothetical protein [Planctomycetaceae bacterium]
QQPELPDYDFSLLVTDWSKINYKNHTDKKDIVRLTHQDDIGCGNGVIKIFVAQKQEKKFAIFGA